MFFIAFLSSQAPLRETERRMENGVMGFLFLGDVWRIFMRMFLGRGGIIALRREGGRKGVAVCIYVSLSISSFLSRCWNWRDYLLFHCGYDARVMCGGMRLVVV